MVTLIRIGPILVDQMMPPSSSMGMFPRLTGCAPFLPRTRAEFLSSYTPHVAVAALAIVLFSISTALHSWQVTKYRTWYFTPVLVGTSMVLLIRSPNRVAYAYPNSQEIVGYAFRLLSGSQSPHVKAPRNKVFL